MKPEQSAEPGQQAVDLRRAALRRRWPGAWRAMLKRWGRDGADAVWLMYGGSYLGRTANVRWAIDPVTFVNADPCAAAPEMSPLQRLSVVMLTHAHPDHCDRALLAQLAEMEIHWIVPEHMLPVAAEAGVPASRQIIARPNQSIAVESLRITPLTGMHWEYAQRWGDGQPVDGIEATAYLIETPTQRLLFPGDTRTYDVSAVPLVGPVDVAFAHVWLGRGAALCDAPPLLDAFCRFVEALQPQRRVALAHLWDVTRDAANYWNRRHADLVAHRLAGRLPGVAVEAPDLWEEWLL